MARWCSGVRAAERLIQDVEECMNDNSVYFHDVTLFPFRSNGGRSNGITAVFEYKVDDKREMVGISLYEHWNSDNICIKIDNYVPVNMSGEQHDIPNVEFKQDQVMEVAYAIQSFLHQYFKIPYPREWNVPHGFKGNGDYLTQQMMDYVDDKMMPTIIDWCDPPGEE